MKKIANIIIGMVIYFLCAILFMGYGHTETHGPLNTSITLRFLELINTNTIVDKSKFKNYEFNWNNDKQPSLVGPAITKDYYLSYSESDEVDKSFSPIEWITEGGWMEDEPWGPASICHFYDPIGIDNGKKYLTDNSGKLETLISIPKSWFTRDAKTWVTSKTENKYGWFKAKEYVVKALNEGNVALKDNYMAIAYRCLGQTLHLVADMGCTPHVRNDSHPPKVSFVVGDPDPYEDICKKLDSYTLVKATAPNPSLKSKFENTQNFEDIFESMAVFTNERFYSGGTISTDRYYPRIRSNNPYPKPLMTEAEYNKAEYTYYKKYEDNITVKMCKDKVPVPFASFFGKDSTRGRPYLDYECVESMASVLMPNVAEAGANVIRLFVPSIKMEITEAKLDSGGIIRGRVFYTEPSQNDEYAGLFKLDDVYNGPVALFVNNKDTEIKVNAKKNRFEFKLEGKFSGLKVDDILQTKLEFGGIVLKSEEKKIGENVLGFIKSKKFIKINFDVDCVWPDGTTTCIFEGDGCNGFWNNNYNYDQNLYSSISWSGGSFTVSHHHENPPEYPFSSDFTITGDVQEDGTITKLTYDYKDSSGWEYYFIAENLKASINKNTDNPNLGYITMGGSGENLKEMKAKEPRLGVAEKIIKNTFSVSLYFGDEFTSY